MSFTTFTAKVTDIDGNAYYTATIGTQEWLAENLKVTSYNDGTAIPLVTDNTAWSNLTTAGHCWYNNDPASKDSYGALYNRYTVNTGKLCASGWHVPTDAEWTTLTTYLGGESVAGDKLKETGNTHWQGTGSTNEIGFTGLPGGFRYPNGSFGNIGDGGSWGSSSVSSTDFGWARTLGNGSNVIRYNSLNVEGLSVRCLKD